MVVSQSKTEEIPHGSLHARRGLSVPVHPEHEGFQMIRIIARNREPHMTDQPRPRLVEKCERLSRSDGARIRIRAAAVIARCPVLDVVFGLRKGREPYIRGLCE